MWDVDTLPEGQAWTDETPMPLDAGQLLVEAGAERQVLPLAGGRTVVGAGPDCDHVLVGKKVAAAHLAIVAKAEEVRIEALAPTRRNGRRIQSAPLASGDELRLGQVRLRYVAPGGAIVRGRRWQPLLLWAAAGCATGYLLILALAAFAGPADAVERAAAPAVAQLAPPSPEDALEAPPAFDQPGAEPAREIPAGAAGAPGAPETDAEVPALFAYLPEEGSETAPSLLVAPIPTAGTMDGAPAGAGADSQLAVVAPATAAREEPQVAPRSDASGAVAPRTSPRRRRSPPRKAEPAALPESDMNGAPAAEASPGKDAPAPAPTLEDVQLAWQAGALDEVVALARASGDPAALRLADRARRFARAVVRARHAPGLAAVPALEEALGIAEEIGRRAPAVDEVRERLAGLHRAAAERAFRSGDRKGALRHVEEALATRPGDREASKLRQTLAAEAATVHREAYALQHLDRARAAALAEEAALLALPGDPVGERARALAARLRGEAPEADVDSAGW